MTEVCHIENYSSNGSKPLTKLSTISTSSRSDGSSAFVCPISNQDYRTNKNLAGRKLDSIVNKTDTLLLWSTKPLSDGNYMVLDARGLDRRVSASELARMKRISRGTQSCLSSVALNAFLATGKSSQWPLVFSWEMSGSRSGSLTN